MNQTASDIIKFLGQALSVFQLAVGSGLIHSTASETAIVAIVTDLEAVVKGTTQPSAALVGQVSQLLNDLKVNGVFTGSIIDQLASGATKFGQWVTEAASGQVIILDENVMFVGTPCLGALIPKTSDIAKQLGY